MALVACGGGGGGDDVVIVGEVMAYGGGQQAHFGGDYGGFCDDCTYSSVQSVGDYGSIPDRDFLMACEIFCVRSYWVSFSLMSERLSSILRISSRACWSRN